MPKSSFRDMLNFEPVTPYVEEAPKVDKSKYESAMHADFGDDPSVAHRRTVTYHGEYEKGADKFAYHFGNTVTGLQTFVNALPNANDFDSAAIANVLGDVGRSFSFMNYIRRQYSYPDSTKPTISEMVSDARTMRSLIGETIADISDPMHKYRAKEGLGSYTNRDYTESTPNGTRHYGRYTESHSGLSLQQTYQAALKERENSGRSGPLIYQYARHKNPILDIPPNELGKWFGQFAEKHAQDVKFRSASECPVVDYYNYISSPYVGQSGHKSPQELLKYAITNLGFSSGYKDWEGFSLGSSHLWGITIKPYVSPNGIGVSLAPNLPVVEVPVWDVDDSGSLKCTFKEFDYGKMPPVTQYSFEVGSLRGTHIPLFDGNFNMPLGFDFENKLTLTFVEDEYHSMQKYMSMFINNIYRPTVGLMAPYDLCTWLVSLTAFRPGMNVNYSFNLICVPEAYTLSYHGTEAPGVETMNIALSIIGMQSPGHSGAAVAPSGRTSAKDTWSKVNWNDVTVKPVNWTKFTDYDDASHSWGTPKDFSKIKDMESAAVLATETAKGKTGSGPSSGTAKTGTPSSQKVSPQKMTDQQVEDIEVKVATNVMLQAFSEAGAVRDPSKDYSNSHGGVGVSGFSQNNTD